MASLLDRRAAFRLARPLILIIGASLVAIVAGCQSSSTTDASTSATPPPAKPVEPSPPTQPATAPADLPTPRVGEWVELFDGATLAGWRILTENAFPSHGLINVHDGQINLGRGKFQTGIGWLGEMPLDNYEISVEVQRVDGYDFFCGLTFPIGDEFATLIVGGWGGSMIGLSNVDGLHAAENITTTSQNFKNGQWYRIRLRVTPEMITVWIDHEQMIELERNGHFFDAWWQQEPARPLGFATYDTTAALRDIRIFTFTRTN